MMKGQWFMLGVTAALLLYGTALVTHSVALASIGALIGIFAAIMILLTVIGFVSSEKHKGVVFASAGYALIVLLYWFLTIFWRG